MKAQVVGIGLGCALLAVASSGWQAPQRQLQMHPRWEIPGLDISPNGGWRVKARRVRNLRAQLRARGDFKALNAPTATGPAQGAAVTGSIEVPVVLISYQGVDSAQFMRDTAGYSALLFGPTPQAGNVYTLRTFYQELSTIGTNPPLFSMRGRVMRWVRLDSAETTYTGDPATSGCTGNPFGNSNCNGLFSTDATIRMHRGMRQALAQLDTGSTGVDFGLFDNDGADGVPNSVDDDGYVDMMMFGHATLEGACGGPANNHIWAHRFVLTDTNSFGQLDFSDYVTNDARPGGGTVRVSDYFAQSALGGRTACDTLQLMPIGTAAHEFGHALGLPDLYDTDSRDGVSEGIGEWGLMGSGNFARPYSPARYEAWSLEQMGWATLRPLTEAGTYTLGPAPISDTIFMINVSSPNPRNEYFLLENRQASQADTALIDRMCVRSGHPAGSGCGGGLLVWHIDGQRLAGGGNQLNTGSNQGVALMQADGLNHLRNTSTPRNRGDAGDPFPGFAATTQGNPYPGLAPNTAFYVSTNPAATKNSDGFSAGFSLDSIRLATPGVAGPVTFRLSFGGPALFTSDVVAQLLNRAGRLSGDQIRYLDHIGNKNGLFDVGDFRAWVDATGAPAATPVVIPSLTPSGEVRP